uniref:Cilia and flagella associated protein 99 n=1 Tax=Cyclopterus lumpus TaxID=8103 RepID=A0A8C3G0T6_CYCLU
MASGFGSLAKEASVLLDKFSAGSQCLDVFMEEASRELQVGGLRSVDTLQKKFILDVVSGCIEHKRLLDVVVNVFYGQKGKCVSRGDRSQFVIICYLATFSLDDLGLQRFSNIITSLDIKKMHTFLTFFFTNLTTWIQEEWNTIYDAAYVEKHCICPLLRWRPEMDILIDQLVVKISHGNQFKTSPIKTTEPQEFSLTKPKPRPLPVPELIPQQEQSKPVSLIYSSILYFLQTLPHRELLYEANMKQFRCVNPHKSEHTKVGATNSWPIKLNSAAILRQGVLYDRQVEEELQRMERLVEGAHEPSSFLHWQKEMREKDLQEELAKIECRRLEGRISYEEAAMARTRIMERNQKTAQLKKEETAQLMRRYAEKRLQDEKEMRDLVQQVAEGHKNSKTAKEKLHKFKQSIVKEVAEQRRELLRQALEEAQAELSRKFKVIREIRAIESLPHVRVRDFDNTGPAGHELLGEMSLVELKERLGLLREAQQTEQHEKREHILEEKHNKKQLLLEQLDAIDLNTRVLAQAAAIRSGKSMLGFRKAMIQDETVFALQKKLEEKQLERQRLKQTESKKPKTSEQAAARTGTPTKVSMNSKTKRKCLTEKSWKELELSLERHLQKDAPYVVSHTKTLQT